MKFIELSCLKRVEETIRRIRGTDNQWSKSATIGTDVGQRSLKATITGSELRKRHYENVENRRLIPPLASGSGWWHTRCNAFIQSARSLVRVHLKVSGDAFEGTLMPVKGAREKDGVRISRWEGGDQKRCDQRERREKKHAIICSEKTARVFFFWDYLED